MTKLTCQQLKEQLEKLEKSREELSDLVQEITELGYERSFDNHFQALKRQFESESTKLNTSLEQLREEDKGLFAIEKLLESYGYDGLVSTTQLQGRECYIAFRYIDKDSQRYAQFFVFPDGNIPTGDLGQSYYKLYDPSDGFILTVEHKREPDAFPQQPHCFIHEGTGEEMHMYTEAWPFESGVAAVRTHDSNPKWQLVDTDFREISDPNVTYENMLQTTEGKTAVQVDGKWGFLDSHGKLAINCIFDEVRPYSEGFAAYRIGAIWGYVDHTGNAVGPEVPPEASLCTHARPFANSFAAVETDMGWHFVHTNMQMMSDVYDEVFSFEQGRAVVTVDGVTEIIDTNFEAMGESIPHRTVAVSGGVIICHETFPEEAGDDIVATHLYDMDGKLIKTFEDYALNYESFTSYGTAVLAGPDNTSLTINRSGNIIDI